MLTPGSEAWAYHFYGNPDAPGWYSKNIVTIRFCGRDMQVHRKAKRAFLHLERVFKEHAPGYAAHISQGQLDDWSYSNRFIAGTSVKSNHSFGIAIDINALRNARGVRGDMPSAVVKRADKSGFRWGGSFSYPDAMHWEVVISPNRIRALFTKDGRFRRHALRPKAGRRR